MLAYDAKTKSVRVIPLDMVPLENVEKEMAINLDEKPLNIFSIPSTVCGVAARSVGDRRRREGGEETSRRRNKA